jgi:hypothetical protein
MDRDVAAIELAPEPLANLTLEGGEVRRQLRRVVEEAVVDGPDLDAGLLRYSAPPPNPNPERNRRSIAPWYIVRLRAPAPRTMWERAARRSWRRVCRATRS